MKNMSPILMAGFVAGWFATAATATAQPAAPPTTTPATNVLPALAAPKPGEGGSTSAPAAPVSSNPFVKATEGTADQGLILNLRGVSIDTALHFLSDSAGFTIIRLTSTRSADTVDVVSDTPVSRDDIIPVFNKVLSSHGLTAIQDGKMLTIETLADAMNNSATKVVVNTNAEDIPADAEVVTEIIPVHTLNPTQVVKDLYTLIPPGAQMNTSEAGNSVIMTSDRADIKRFAQIIGALDSTGNGDLQVFLLNFADSKAIATELKDVFSDQGGTGNQTGGNPFAAFIGGGRGGRGGGGGGNAANSDERRTGVHVNAVSDDENNAVLVSAPADFMPGISNIIAKLDIPQEDAVQIRLFFLTNADCTAVVTELLQLYPDPNTQAGGAQAAGGRRGAAAFGGGGGGAANSAATMSDRMKKQATVNAVADPRTQSVLVTASKDTMNAIEGIIHELDANQMGHVKVYVFQPQFADVLDLASPMQDLFQSTTGRTSSAANNNQNPLAMRIQTSASTSTTTASSTLSGSTGGGGGGGGGGR